MGGRTCGLPLQGRLGVPYVFQRRPFGRFFGNELGAHFLATLAASGHLGPVSGRSKPPIANVIERRRIRAGASLRGALQLEFALGRHHLFSDREKGRMLGAPTLGISSRMRGAV